MNDKKDLVSKESFEAYLEVQESGATNMCDIKTVGKLSGLQREIIIDIMDNYEYLETKYADHLVTEGQRIAEDEEELLGGDW